MAAKWKGITILEYIENAIPSLAKEKIKVGKYDSKVDYLYVVRADPYQLFYPIMVC